MSDGSLTHTVGLSKELYERWGRSPSRIRDFLWANAPEEREKEITTRAGTLFVAGLRTRCPQCGEYVEPKVKAVMMDDEQDPPRSKAYHLDCAKVRGWAR
jgi:phage terminase large subunit GpA-like protein